MRNRNNIIKRLTAAMLVILILTSCLGITAYALFYATVEIEENYFKTGKVDIELEFGEDRKDAQLITEDEYLFEPGMTVEKTFWVVNKSTDDVYYRLYFDSLAGKLANIMEIKIWEAESGEVYFDGIAKGLKREKMGAFKNCLKENDEIEMKISFHYPELSGNATQNQYMSFDLRADAVQTKNNPDKQFE